MDNEINTMIHSLIRPGSYRAEIDTLQQQAAQVLLGRMESLVRGLAEHYDAETSLLNQDDIQQAIIVAARLKALPLEIMAAMVNQPGFNYWVKAMRRCSHESNPAQQQLLLPHAADFIWPLEVQYGPSKHHWQTMTDDRGGLRCPTLGRFIELGPDYRNTRVGILVEQSRLLICCEDRISIQVPLADLTGEVQQPLPSLEREGYQINLAPLLGEEAVELWSRDEWLRVHFTGTQQRRDGIAIFGSNDRWFDLHPDLEPFLHAFILLRHYWPQAYDEVGCFTQVMVPMRSESDDDTRLAFTVSSRQGAIFIDGGKPYDIVDNILHENAHIKLRQIQLLDPLLQDPDQEQPRYAVPWRKDKRPIPGILEGIFVFMHVAEFEKQLSLSEQCGATQKLVDTIRDVRHGLTIIQQHAALTEAGQAFVEAITPWVEDVEAVVEQLPIFKYGT